VKVVIDTNVLISAVLGGHAQRILDLLRHERFQLLISSDILTEYLDVLHRPKFKLSPQVVNDIAIYLFRNALMVTPPQILEEGSIDPKDNRFLEAALAGNADMIVSGDHHLLDLSPFQGISVITVRAFLDLFADDV
jgi:uncharacterized protein